MHNAKVSTRMNRSMQHYLRDKMKRRQGAATYSKNKIQLSKAVVQKNEANRKLHDAVKTNKVILQLTILSVCMIIIYVVLTKMGLY